MNLILNLIKKMLSNKKIEIDVKDSGKISDGFNTFSELRSQYILSFMTLMNQNPDISWKTKIHFDGEHHRSDIALKAADGETTVP